MTRALLLSTAALAALAAAGPASAACLEDPAVPSITCTGLDNAPVSSAADNLTVIVGEDAAVTSAARNTPAVSLDGDGARVENDGAISHTFTPNNNPLAIRGSGADLTVVNGATGVISSTDRAIEVVAPSVGGLTVENDGEIASRRQTIRVVNEDAEPPAAERKTVTVRNSGVITSSDDRAIQVRGFGADIVNEEGGEILGGGETIEGRDGFSLTNRGVIRSTATDPDAVDDAVQFGAGELVNEAKGLIEGGDDGIDVDSGLIRNAGRIESRGTADDQAAIDVDGAAEPLEEPFQPAPSLRIENSGAIVGGVGILYEQPDVANDPEKIGSTAEQTIVNTGLIEGLSGVAIRFSPIQADSLLDLSGDSVIRGDVLFGGGDDTLAIGALTSGVLINSVFDGGDGPDTVVFSDAFSLASLRRFSQNAGGLILLALLQPNGDVTDGEFRNFETWRLGGVDYTTDELAALAPVPLPATLPLLAAGGVALLALRRRRG